MEEKRELKEKGKEKCVICGMETEYHFNTPVMERKYYVEGAGQLCGRCYFLIYYGERFGEGSKKQ